VPKLVYSNIRPFFLPDKPFSPPDQRKDYLRAWLERIPANSELGPWALVDVREDTHPSDRTAGETHSNDTYIDDTPFWRAYPLEIGVRMERILHCAHTPDEHRFEDLRKVVARAFPEFNGVLRWEDYYLDWGYGSSDVIFELEFASLDQINSDLRDRITRFNNEILYYWREAFALARLNQTAPVALSVRQRKPRGSNTSANSTSAQSASAISDAKTNERTQEISKGASAAFGFSITYADYFALWSPSGSDPAGEDALRRLTANKYQPADETDSSTEIDPGLKGLAMARGEYAFLVTSTEAIHRSRNLCSVGVLLYEAMQSLATSVEDIPTLRRKLVDTADPGARMNKQALDIISEAELRVIEIGSMAEPDRFAGDPFEQSIYEAFWKTQRCDRALAAAEKEIRLSKALMENSVKTHNEKQQWRLSVIGFFIAVLGLSSVFKDVLETLSAVQGSEPRLTPLLILSLQLGFILLASAGGYLFSRR
jgi:hypothetical protein